MNKYLIHYHYIVAGSRRFTWNWTFADDLKGLQEEIDRLKQADPSTVIHDVYNASNIVSISFDETTGNIIK